MMLLKNRTPEFLIGANVLADAFATAFFSAGIGYVIVEVGIINFSQAMNAIGLGLLAGSFSSLILGRVADQVGTRKLLSIVQVLQISTYLIFGYSTSQSTLIISIVTIFFLGRLVSPLRGALPPRFMDRATIIVYKTRLRTLTLITILCADGAVSAVTIMNWRIKVFAVAIGMGCYLLCLLSTTALSWCSELPRQRTPQWFGVRTDAVLARSEWGMWVYLLFTFSVVAIGVALIPFVVAHAGKQVSWLLLASSVIGIVINFAVHRGILKNGQLDRGLDRRLRNSLILVVSILLASMAIALLMVLHLAQAVLVFVLLMLVVFVLAHCGQTLATVVAWDIQYSAGNEKDRAYIVALFSLTSSLGAGAAQFLASYLFHTIH
ncbi:hypothetical protein EML15_04405 [Corynebacterium sp. sy017]|uniref:hypothetical protein n=1 Tax=unclassified Corynebacterium TaxID=2624378 RepID=UPI0011865F02|nr:MULTISPECIES: hypothetical protein [unclassified Corynebacterium]MBP3088388.1 hypothetical protein [Corynebacterium sp. sy017]TSD91703.1 hypothetical protein ELY17_04405 [Corynebacterium sp. SY003]